MSDNKNASSLPLPDALASNFQDAARWFSQLWASSADAATGGRAGGGSGIPSMLLPTLDVKELDKRIADMRSVQSWLELNLGLLRTTIQGLEMQKQTLQTWQDFQNPPPSRKPAASASGTSSTAASSAGGGQAKAAPAAEGPDAAFAAGFQPQAWWDALNQQFGQMAAQANEAAQQMAAAGTAKPAAKGSKGPKST